MYSLQVTDSPQDPSGLSTVSCGDILWGYLIEKGIAGIFCIYFIKHKPPLSLILFILTDVCA
jgi:hypothetical protein